MGDPKKPKDRPSHENPNMKLIVVNPKKVSEGKVGPGNTAQCGPTARTEGDNVAVEG